MTEENAIDETESGILNVAEQGAGDLESAASHAQKAIAHKMSMAMFLLLVLNMGSCIFLKSDCPNTANAFVFWHFLSERAAAAGYSQEEITAKYIKLAPEFLSDMVRDQDGGYRSCAWSIVKEEMMIGAISRSKNAIRAEFPTINLEYNAQDNLAQHAAWGKLLDGELIVWECIKWALESTIRTQSLPMLAYLAGAFETTLDLNDMSSVQLDNTPKTRHFLRVLEELGAKF